MTSHKLKPGSFSKSGIGIIFLDLVQSFMLLTSQAGLTTMVPREGRALASSGQDGGSSNCPTPFLFDQVGDPSSCTWTCAP